MTVEKPIRGADAAPVRIADVARRAGVSTATVSRALANPDIVNAETRERVLEAVRATGYTPNVAARNLRARRSMMVLVVVPDIGNPFFSEVLRGVDETLSAAGYGLIIGNLGQRAELEDRFVDVAFAGQVDGVLLLNGAILAGRGRSLADASVPLVAACEVVPGAGIPQVEVQNREAAGLVARHLVGLGHRRLGYIQGPPANILERERFRGFRDALEEIGAEAGDVGEGPDAGPAEIVVTFPGDFSFEAGSRAATAFLALGDRPTAIFAANDEMAIGFIKAVTAAGLRVPEQVSVVGFDAIDFSEYCEPTLTTIVQPRGAIGRKAAEMLLARMVGETDDLPPHVVRFHADLRVGGSTGPAPSGG